jgi:hypothetical protein
MVSFCECFSYVIIQGMSSSILIGKRSSMLWGELRNCLFGEEGRVLTLGSTNANVTCTFEYIWQVLQSYENLQVGQVLINILPFISFIISRETPHGLGWVIQLDSWGWQGMSPGWSLLEKIRNGASDEALVSQVGDAVQRHCWTSVNFQCLWQCCVTVTSCEAFQ